MSKGGKGAFGGGKKSAASKRAPKLSYGARMKASRAATAKAEMLQRTTGAPF